MRKLTTLLATSLLFLASLPSHAITWVSSSVRDPVSGHRVKVSEPASSGSYIYQYPEKSDQVFWPYTDDNWLWFNPKSGYIAFGSDFEGLEPSKSKEMKAWLKEHFDRENLPRSRLELLTWAEKVYATRGMNDDFWCHYYRLMAFETRSNPVLSLEYVRKALPLLIARNQSEQEPGQQMETLYLLSEYNRRLGRDDEATRFLEQLSSIQSTNDLASFKTYLLKIAEEQRASNIVLQ